LGALDDLAALLAAAAAAADGLAGFRVVSSA
jgi:hypothetical protein